MKKITLNEAKGLLKKRTALCSLWNCEDKKNWPYQLGYLVYKDLFKEVFLFDPKMERLKYGSKIMKERLFDIIIDKNPDYIFLLLEANDIGLDTLEKIKNVSPKTKTIAIFGDDDIHFETRSRYYALFLDYCISCPIKYAESYKKDGLKNAIPFPGGVNTKNFRPMNLNKKYDVVCIGQPYSYRVEIIRFLIKNGIKVNIWGHGWGKYPEFEKIYGGPLDHEEIVKVVNQTRIYLGFCKNRLGESHNTGKFFESSACGTFCLVDEFPEYNEYLKINKEIVMFRDNKDLLEKIKYYLKNESKRENIAQRAYKKVIKNHSYHTIYTEIFQRILTTEKNLSRKDISKLSKRFIELSNEDMALDYSILDKRLKDYSYVCFSNGKSVSHRYKNILQAYSLEKTGKDISCCDYFVFSPGLGSYLKSDIFRASLNIERNGFNELLNINQIMARKDYFIKYLSDFKKFYEKGEINIIDKDNVAFIEIPLVQISRLNKNSSGLLYKLDLNSLENSFQLKFMFKLYSLLYQKKLLFNKYPYKLILEAILKGDVFILKYLLNSVLKREKRLKMKEVI